MKQNNLKEIQVPSVNSVHDEALRNEFVLGIGKKVLILTPSFPFVFIGRILDVIGDIVSVDVETTTIGELENKRWNIHVNQIDAYYIEQKGLPKIPNLRDGSM